MSDEMDGGGGSPAMREATEADDDDDDNDVAVSWTADRVGCCSETTMVDGDTASLDETAAEAFDDDDDEGGNGDEAAVDEDSGERSTSILSP